MSFIKNIKNKLSEKKTLDNIIFNEVLIILGILAIVTGVQVLLIYTLNWLSVIFFLGSFSSILFLVYANYSSSFKIIKVLFTILLYMMAIAAWFFDGGIRGTNLIFMFVIIIYTISIYKKIHIELFIINLVIVISLSVFNLKHPEFLIYNDNNELFNLIDVLATYTVAGVSVLLIFRTIFTHNMRKNQSLKQQTELIKKQTVELTELISTKDKMISIIGHDLRSPLSSIIGLGELLDKRFDEKNIKDSKLLINHIITSGTNSFTLLNNLIEWVNFNKNNAQNIIETVDLKEVFNETISLHNSAAYLKKITINYNQSEPIEIDGTENMLRTIARNIVSNAIKFTYENGNIYINVYKENKEVRIKITDDGMGMDEETIEKILNIDNSFSTIGTDHERGSGMGLILCIKFIKKLKGTLHIESSLGNGSSFLISFPLKQTD